MDVHYTIVRSHKRQRVTITVERDRRVVVRAPAGASDERIEQVVQAKRQWLYGKLRHEQKYQGVPHPPGKELVSGESSLYLGRSYKIEVVDDGTEDIRFSGRFIIPASRATERKRVLYEWYINRAESVVLPRVSLFARDLGVRFSTAKIVDNRYRWGSCTVKDNVNFNWRLIKAPMFVIDYVIVHELAHLIESNHTPAFWNIVRAQIPRMEKAKEWLKEYGEVLEHDV